MELKLLAQELKSKLENNTSTKPDKLERCNIAIVLCRSLLMDFKKRIVGKGFKDKDIEIEFFKEIKQIPLSNLVYHFDLKSFEIRFPKGNLEVQKKYIQKKLNKLNKFFVDNLDFVQYIEQGKTYLDDRYFTRKYFNEFNITHSRYYFRDPDFSSSHDLLMAKLIANGRLINFLDKKLENIDSKNSKYCDTEVLKNLVWTASRTDMTELGYSLKKSGSINQGNVSIKELINALEQTFNFDSGDPYKNYSDIRIRKKSRTKFLDELSIGLLSKMDKDDE